MKKIFLYSSLFFAAISTMMVACKEEISLLSPPDRDFISIAELRDRYQGEPVTLLSSSGDKHLFISGIVVSHPAGNNVPEGKVIIQNGTDDRLRGITLSVEDLASRYLQGDSIIAKIEGATLERVDGALQVSGLTTAEVGRISTGNVQAVHLATNDLGVLATGRDIYENTVVSLLDVNVLGVIRDQVFGDGDVTLSDGTHTVLVKTMENASMAENLVPLEGNFTGIVSYTLAGEPYLSLRRPVDIDGTRYMAPEFYTTFPETFNTANSRKPLNVTSSGEDELPSGTWHYTFGSSTVAGSNIRAIDGIGYAAWFAGSNQERAEAKIEMWFDLEFGASEFSFYYAPATNNGPDQIPVTFIPEYSQDGGISWDPVDPNEPNFTPVEGSTTVYGPVVTPTFLQYKKDNLEIEGPVRFRIRRQEIVAPAAGGRWAIDDIYIKPHE